MSNGRTNLTYVGAGLLGAALGVAAGLLFAPARGRDTRRRLSYRIAEEKDALVRRGEMAFEGVAEVLQEGRRKLARAVNG
jgi:gas vesicle protein